MSERRTAFAIVGPTAAGKTRVSFELARRIGAEIISVDSRQVYRYLDIGTDKISREERAVVPHHLIDVADPDEVFTAADFLIHSAGAVQRIRERGRIPLFVGGTALYYRALEGGLLTESLPSDENLRRKIEKRADEAGSSALHDELESIDPERASRIHPNDRIRLVRALEIITLTGRSVSDIYETENKIDSFYDIHYLGVNMPREQLFAKIEKRVREQFDAGYVDEVKWLISNGYTRELPALQGFGYREIADYLEGSLSLEEAILGDIRATKIFSRRQMTWFKQFYPIMWYDISRIPLEDIVCDMERYISEKSKIGLGDQS